MVAPISEFPIRRAVVSALNTPDCVVGPSCRDVASTTRACAVKAPVMVSPAITSARNDTDEAEAVITTVPFTTRVTRLVPGSCCR